MGHHADVPYVLPVQSRVIQYLTASVIRMNVMSWFVYFVVQGAAAGTDNKEVQRRAIEAGKMCASYYKELLELVNQVSHFSN